LLLLTVGFPAYYYWVVSFRQAVIFSSYPYNDPDPNRLSFKIDKGQVEYVRGYISVRWAKRAFTTRHIILSGFEWEDLNGQNRKMPLGPYFYEHKRTVRMSMWWSLLLLLPLVFCLAYRPRARWHQKGRCAQCGYDLTGNASGVCPECGTKIAQPEAPAAG
jgi:hypothetical protein